MATSRVPPEVQEQADMVELLSLPAFKRFLLRFAIASDMLSSTSGSEDRLLRHAEGRRSLGFDVFRWADEAMSVSHPSALSFFTLGMVLRDEAQPPGGKHAVQESQIDDQDDDDVRR